jgi:hypothetical protein
MMEINGNKGFLGQKYYIITLTTTVQLKKICTIGG